MAALVLSAAAAGAFLVAPDLVVRVLDDVALLVAFSAGASRGVRRVPVGPNHVSPCFPNVLNARVDGGAPL